MFGYVFVVLFYLFIFFISMKLSKNNENNKKSYNNFYNNNSVNKINNTNSHSNVYEHNSNSDVHKLYEKVNNTNYTTHSDSAHTDPINQKVDVSYSPIRNEFGISTQEIKDVFGENNPIKNYYENNNSIEDYKSFWQKIFKS